MAKATSPVVLAVTISVTEKNLRKIAEYACEEIYCEHGNSIPEMAGVVKNELLDAMVADPAFQKCVIRSIELYGTDFIDEPYDYVDSSDLVTPNLARVIMLVEAMADIDYEADRDEEVKLCIAPLKKARGQWTRAREQWTRA